MATYPIPWCSHSDAGVFLFNQREYWNASEAWEKVWTVSRPNPKIFYQGLMQIAGGFVKVQQRQHKLALANLRKGLEKYRVLDNTVGDLNIPILYKDLFNQSRGVRVSLFDQGAARLAAYAWDLWPRIEYRR